MNRQDLPIAAVLALLASSVSAHEAFPAEFRLDARTAEIGIEIDGETVGKWQLDPSNYPRTLPLPVKRDTPTAICFTEGDRRTCGDFVPGQARLLEITFDGAVLSPTIVAQFDRPAARFDPAYQAAHRGRTVVEVPEVYELVNVAIAITPYAVGDRDMVYQDSPYYRAVRDRFDAHADHPLIRRIDALLRENRSNYFPFKMNAYAFVFDQSGQIVQSPIYDRTGFAGSVDNPVRPALAELNDFARVAAFRAFYAEHTELYQEQIRFFEDEAGVARISAWLTERFPSVQPYDGVKIVFSPLVAYNQSLTTIEADGYHELQPHVNYPYGSDPRLTDQGAAIQRSAVLFTEMNHGYVNPTTQRYAEKVARAFADRSVWADDDLGAGNYAGAEALFNEYMNWGLVALYYADLMSETDFAIANRSLVGNLQEGRGFRRFSAFNVMLLDLYRSRGRGQSIEDLYPAILGWAATQSSSAADKL